MCLRCEWPGCESAFISQIQLDVHFADVHTGDKKFKCDYPECTWIGTNHAQELRLHKLRKHEGIKIFNKKIRESDDINAYKKHICQYPDCGKKFLYKSVLTQHLRTHQILGFLIIFIKI